MSDSLAQKVARLPVEQQQEWLDELETELQTELAKNPWWFIGRPEQLFPPGDWFIWLMLAGRRFGKTRAAAENFTLLVVENPKARSGSPTEWAVIGETFSDCRKICVEGPSGLLGVFRRRGMVEDVDFKYNRSQWEITLSTGQKIHMMGADDPDVGRGFGLEGLWADEIAKWPYAYRSWTEGLMPTLSDSLKPRAIITTTPKPAHPLIKSWLNRKNGSVVFTTGSIDDNRKNLSAELLEEMHDLYDDTRIGEQELHGKFLEDVEGALWLYENILLWRGPLPEIRRTVVAIDPAITNTENSDETGICVASLCDSGELIVRADRTMKASPKEWADRAIQAFYEFEAERIVYEDNQGGDAWKTIIHDIDPYIKVEKVHAGAKDSKRSRAEPIASLYEQHKVWHVAHFDKLEGQMTTWEPYDKKQKSPDRVDALVYALTELNPSGSKSRFISELMDFCPNPACGQANNKGQVICAHCGRPMNGL